MIKWIRTSRLSIKNSLSSRRFLSPLCLQAQNERLQSNGKGGDIGVIYTRFFTASDRFPLRFAWELEPFWS